MLYRLNQRNEDEVFKMKFYKRTLTGKRKMIGEIRGLVFFKHIEFSKHFYWKANALGLDSKLLDVLISKKIPRIVLIDDESGKRYEIPSKRLFEKGWLYPKKGDQYYGKFQPQVFLAIDRWNIKTGSGSFIQEGRMTNYEIAEREAKIKEKEEKDRLRVIRKVEVKQEVLFR